MLAILISTFARYEELARWTAAQIERQWASHPPIFYSGLKGEHAGYLHYDKEEKDWMSVTLHAVEQLQQRGFTHAYLILDDHPPVGPCHEVALNEILPSLSLKLNATYIGLLGYGQHRELAGKILEKQDAFLERSFMAYRWKFSLHPGLWNLKGLHELLVQRMKVYEKASRTAWKFEQHHDNSKNLDLLPLLISSYRINGSVFLKKKWSMKKEILCERAQRFIADVMLFKSKVTGGLLARDHMQKRLFWRYCHYLGPYPLFWSGVMQQGKPNQHWEQWLERSRDPELQASWNEVKKLVFSAVYNL